MKIQVTEHRGQVAVLFSEAVDWFGLSPTQARELATQLSRGADTLEQKMVSETIPSPLPESSR